MLFASIADEEGVLFGLSALEGGRNNCELVIEILLIAGMTALSELGFDLDTDAVVGAVLKATVGAIRGWVPRLDFVSGFGIPEWLSVALGNETDTWAG